MGDYKAKVGRITTPLANHSEGRIHPNHSHKFMSSSNILNSGLSHIPLSVLDLAPVRQGGSIAEALHNSRDLAQHAERWGYKRFWLAEHHNIPGIASAATSVLIGYVADGTQTIRVGSGGVMLPNHAPLVIAEQFGTLASLYPGRIDLGLGRAPGTDQQTMRALRRDLNGADDFPANVAELQALLGESQAGQAVRALPGEGTNVPIWLLGSSGFSAHLAGSLGLPFAFAAHFQPDNLIPALELYRSMFRPSEALSEPYAMVAVPVVAAETDAKAKFMSSSMYLSFLNLIRNRPQPVMPPVENVEALANPLERAALRSKLDAAIIGSPETVQRGLEELLERTQANELMIVSNAYDYADRLRSYEIVSESVQSRREAGVVSD
jgi:luciferase family oxidoreductase group 1